MRAGPMPHSMPVTRARKLRQDVRECLDGAAKRRDGLSSIALQRIGSLVYPTQQSDYDPLFWWLKASNAGLLDPGNPYLIDLAVKNLPTDDPVIEIGSFCGISANLLRRSLDRHGRSNAMWCCDPWQYGEGSSIDTTRVTYDAYNAFVKESFQRAAQMFSGHELPHAIESDSAAFFAHWRRAADMTDVFGRSAPSGGPVSLCFIDGAHDETNVIQDFANCDAHLVLGGLLLFDDSSAIADHDVHGVVKHVLHSTNYELVDRNPNYLIRKVA